MCNYKTFCFPDWKVNGCSSCSCMTSRKSKTYCCSFRSSYIIRNSSCFRTYSYCCTIICIIRRWRSCSCQNYRSCTRNISSANWSCYSTKLCIENIKIEYGSIGGCYSRECSRSIIYLSYSGCSDLCRIISVCVRWSNSSICNTMYI